jgi:uncharacterized secreted protein with C-terminal beta-propeller domain
MQKEFAISLIILIIAAALIFAAQPPAKYQEKHFSSYGELSDFLKARSQTQYYDYGMLGAERVMASTAAPTAAGASESKATDYSTTNVQVAGVDEPDIVKTDGKYIYTASSDKLTIVDAYPAEGMKTVSVLKANGSISNMFVNKDRLVVFGSAYNYGPYGPLDATAGAPISESMPYYRSSQNAFIYVYDITDRANPVLVRNITLEGSYKDARMIGDYVYAIAQQPVRTLDSGPVLPLMSIGMETKEISADNIAYFDEYDTYFSYNFFIAVNTQNDAEAPNEKVFLLGYSQDLYASQDNIYTVSTKYMTEAERNGRLMESLMPSLPLELQSGIREIQGRNISSYEKTYETGKLIQNYAANLGPEEGAKFMKALEERMIVIITAMEKDYEKTVIHKISVSGPNIE